MPYSESMGGDFGDRLCVLERGFDRADVAINPDEVGCVGKVDNNRSYINLGNGVQITVEGTVRSGCSDDSRSHHLDLCWHGARSTWLRRCFRLKTNSDSRIVDAMARIESLSYRSNSPLAFCPTHGLFVFTGMAATGNAKLSFSHCGTNCPTCGGSSEILPGLYEPDGANIRLLLDPNVSAEALDALQKLLRAVLAGEMTSGRRHKGSREGSSGVGKAFQHFRMVRSG